MSHKHWHSESYQHSFTFFCYLSFISYHGLTGRSTFVEQTKLPRSFPSFSGGKASGGKGWQGKSQKNPDNKNEKKIGQKIKMTFGLGVCCV